MKSPDIAAVQPSLVFYQWPRGFLMLTHSFVVDRGDSPTQRPSNRLMLGRHNPFEIVFTNGERVKAKAVLMSPNAQRRHIVALDSGFVLMDMGVATSEYEAVNPLLTNTDSRVIDFDLLTPLLPRLQEASTGMLDAAEIPTLRSRIVHAITGAEPAPTNYDPRVQRALALIHTMPLQEVSLAKLATAVHLSPDRLRHIFKEQLGYSISHYARTNAVWKFIGLWTEEADLTHLAAAVGFYDYSHFFHAFKEMFQTTPQALLRSREKIRVIACN